MKRIPWVRLSQEVSHGVGEYSDCAVHAFAVLMRLPYIYAHTAFARLGRNPGEGVHFYRLVESLGLERRPELIQPSLMTTLPGIQKGRYLVAVTEHIFAVVDGVVHDLQKPRPLKRVDMVYSHPGFK